MSSSGQENIERLPFTEVHKERFARQKLESVQTMDELIVAIGEIGRFNGSLKTYTAEEVLHDLAVLESQLHDLKVMDQLPVCNLTEFTNALGLRKAIARALISSGYLVNPDILEDPEPPLAG